MKTPTYRQQYLAEYCALQNAIHRCHVPTNAHYANYGGRGLEVHPSFREPEAGFRAFMREIGAKPQPALTLDRINNDLGYQPGNISWVSRSDNQLNRRTHSIKVRDLGWGLEQRQAHDSLGRLRTTVVAVIEFEGVTRSVAEWSAAINIKSHTIRQRASAGWPVELILSPFKHTPVKGKSHGVPCRTN